MHMGKYFDSILCQLCLKCSPSCRVHPTTAAVCNVTQLRAAVLCKAPIETSAATLPSLTRLRLHLNTLAVARCGCWPHLILPSSSSAPASNLQADGPHGRHSTATAPGEHLQRCSHAGSHHGRVPQRRSGMLERNAPCLYRPNAPCGFA